MLLDLFPPVSRNGDVWSDQSKGALYPTILFLYGGSWKSGSRRLYRPLGLALSQAGFAVAIADYRLYPEVTFPGFMEDAAAALSWVQAFAPEVGGDPSDTRLMGHAAGAPMGALLRLEPAWLAAETPEP